MRVELLALAMHCYWWVALPCLLTRTLALAAGRGGRMPSLADRRSVSEEQCRVCLETGSVAGAAYDQGLATYRVPMALHALNRARLCEALSAAGASGVVLLEGGEQQTRYDTDHEPVFRQESYFQWLFGVAEPGCYGAVRLSDGEATLFVPDLRSETYEIFCGKPPALADFEARYEVEACRFVDDLAPWLDAELEGGETLRAPRPEQRLRQLRETRELRRRRPIPQGPRRALPRHRGPAHNQDARGDRSAALRQLRLLDGPLRGHARGQNRHDGVPTRVALPAPHVHARRLQAHGIYVHLRLRPQPGGAALRARGRAQQPRGVPAPGVPLLAVCLQAGSVRGSSTYNVQSTILDMHFYKVNSSLPLFQVNDGDIILSDMGCESAPRPAPPPAAPAPLRAGRRAAIVRRYYCYASDITCSYPASGKFSPDQRAV